MAEMTLKQGNNKMISKGIMRGLITIVISGVVIGALTLGYIWFSAGDGQASAPISAPELSVQPDDDRVLFSIVPEESEVRFIIDEMLLGEPKTVVGTTDQVAGDLLLDFEEPSNSQIGLIRVNVRTLSTDNEFRNRALRGQILEADQAEFEYADFAVTEIIDLPNAINIGETVNFQIIGNLSVHGVTHVVTFEATLTVISETRLEGIASATVQYADFDISIPEAPGVADISDALRLEIDFVATVQ
jgi:polyisoprenoid-binding protein YceI